MGRMKSPLAPAFTCAFLPFFSVAFTLLASIHVQAEVAPNAASEKSVVSATPVPSAPRPSLVLVTRAVAEVADRIITSREVRISDAVEQAMTGKSPSSEGFRVLTGVEKNFPGEVTAILDEWIVYLEAKSLSSSLPTRTDLTAAIKGVQDFWKEKPGWLALEVSADELKEMVERKLIAKDFERLKSDPELSPVSDDDALSYFRKNRLRFDSLPFSTFKDSIRTFLVKSQTDRRLAEWREVLRRKYRARNFIAG